MTKTQVRFVVAWACHAIAFTAGVLDGVAAEPMTVSVDATRRVPVSPDLYGVFYEEINHAGDGGLYAELIENRSFEENELGEGMTLSEGELRTERGWRYRWKPETPHRGWAATPGGEGRVRLSLEKSSPLTDASPNALRVQVLGAGPPAGVVSEGYWGVPLEADAEYELSFYARVEGEGQLMASLENEDGSAVYAGRQFEGVSPGWQKHHAVLRTSAADNNGRLAIRLTKPGTLWLDMVSLFPRHTYRNRVPGLRRDLVEMVEALSPRFFRFPGGCVVEGCTLDNRIKWKQTVGPFEERPGHWNLWGYRTTDGLGFHEFLQLSEDLEAEAMYVVNVGISCQARRPEVAVSEQEIIDTYLQDTLDALEYATGPASSRWGSARARNGRVEPFTIKYVEIGNENSGPDYHRAYRIFYEAIKQKYPKILTIANERIPNYPVEIVDEHYYATPEWFFRNAARYDDYDRDGPKVYVGEYAVNQKVGGGNLLGALAEAAFMIGMERNSDLVTMASYAPLFENVNDREWPVNLIQFDGTRVVGRSSYHVQKLFSDNVPSVMLGAEIDGQQPQRTTLCGGKIGVRTWRTDATFADLRVTDRSPLGSKETTRSGLIPQGIEEFGGAWTHSEQSVRQTDRDAEDTLALLKRGPWSDCTIELRARKNSGEEGFIVVFQYGDDQHAQWNLGGWGNSRHALQVCQGSDQRIVAERQGAITTGRWYDLRIEIRGGRVSCYLDGELMHDEVVQATAAPTFFANAGIDTEQSELVLKLVNASADSKQVQIKLAGFRDVSDEARVFTLSGSAAGSENSLSKPTAVTPTESRFTGASSEFHYTVDPLSVTVLRARVRE